MNTDPPAFKEETRLNRIIAAFSRHDVSAFPVLNEKSQLEGLLEARDLLNADISIKRSKLGEQAGETKKLRSATTFSLMQKNISRASPDTPIRGIIISMLEKGIPTAIIEKGGKVAGIVTPKLILKLLGQIGR